MVWPSDCLLTEMFKFLVYIKSTDFFPLPFVIPEAAVNFFLILGDPLKLKVFF